MNEPPLPPRHLVLALQDLVEHPQDFVGVLGLPLPLPVEEQVVLHHSQNVLIGHPLEQPLVLPHHPLLAPVVHPPLHKIPEHPHHRQVVVIPPLCQAPLEFLQVSEALLKLCTVKHDEGEVVEQLLPLRLHHHLLVLPNQLAADLAVQSCRQQVYHILLPLLAAYTALLQQTEHQLGRFLVVLRAEVGLGEKETKPGSGFDREDVVDRLLEISSVIEVIGVKRVECFNGGLSFKVGLGQLLPEGDLEGGDDEALLVLNVIRTILEELLGKLVYFVMVLALNCISQ